MGEDDDVAQAFAEHARQRHVDEQVDAGTEAVIRPLQKALLVDGSRLYFGNEFERTAEGNGFRVTGAGFVMHRFSAAASFSCLCVGNPTGGACKVQLHGSGAQCLNDVCQSCGWSVDIVSLTNGEPKTLPPFDF